MSFSAVNNKKSSGASDQTDSLGRPDSRPASHDDRTTVVLPGHLLSETNNEEEVEFNFFNEADEGDPLDTETAFNAEGSHLSVPIEDALMEALHNPNERMNVLRIEKDIYNFVMSSQHSMELSRMNNSFRRLLAYKIAQRFGLEHSMSETRNERGETLAHVIVYRSAYTFVPAILLVHIASNLGLLEPMPIPPLPQQQHGSATQSKVMVMKRSTREQVDRKGASAQRQVQTAEDKEKQYLEARARIFGDSGEEDPEAREPDEASRVSPDKTPPATMDAVVAPVNSQAHSPPPDESIEVKAEEPWEARRPPRNINNSNSKRSVMRNKDLEKTDPDFARRADPRLYAQQPPMFTPQYLHTPSGYPMHYQQPFPMQGGYAEGWQQMPMGYMNPYYAYAPHMAMPQQHFEQYPTTHMPPSPPQQQLPPRPNPSPPLPYSDQQPPLS
jgi:hypothetical protein